MGRCGGKGQGEGEGGPAFKSIISKKAPENTRRAAHKHNLCARFTLQGWSSLFLQWATFNKGSPPPRETLRIVPLSFFSSPPRISTCPSLRITFNFSLLLEILLLLLLPMDRGSIVQWWIEREREIGNWNRWGLIGVEFGLESALVGIKPGAWTKGWEGVMGVIRAWLVNDWYDRINRRDYHSDDRFSLRWTLSKEFFFSICFCSRRHIGLSSINKNEGVTHKEDCRYNICVHGKIRKKVSRDWKRV